MKGKTLIRPDTSDKMLSFDGGKNRLVFASLKPATGKTLTEQLNDIFNQLNALLATNGIKASDIVKEVVFLRKYNSKKTCQPLLSKYYAGALPSTSFIIQPPADGEHVALEIMAIQGEKVQLDKVSDNLTVVRDSDCRWAYIGGIEPTDRTKKTFAQANDCFKQMHRQLKKAGFHFNQVVRTWLYERDIVAMEKNGSGVAHQRYQILNDARRKFFTEGNGGDAFTFPLDLPPASTGIGMSEGTFVMECLALDVPSGAIEITPLKNPEQIDAHAYTQEVLLRGAAAVKAAPLFSRGMSIRKDYRMMLISGTASIKGQATVWVDDPIGQARTTLENIDLVLKQAQASLKDVQQLRIYIKNSKQKAELAQRIAAIQQVVEKTLPNIPKLFLVGDVCRDNLLVEIEALSFVKSGISKPKRTKA